MFQQLVYSDGEIAVSLVADSDREAEKMVLHLAMRWLPPKPYKDRQGNSVNTTNCMGGETDWFWLPTSFGYAVGRVLIEQKTASPELARYFDEIGFAKLVQWLVDDHELTSGMCY
jgi:hypothetical protein